MDKTYKQTTKIYLKQKLNKNSIQSIVESILTYGIIV